LLNLDLDYVCFVKGTASASGTNSAHLMNFNLRRKPASGKIHFSLKAVSSVGVDVRSMTVCLASTAGDYLLSRQLEALCCV